MKLHITTFRSNYPHMNDVLIASMSSQLSWEEVQHVIESYGFQILEMEWREVTYARRPSAMMWNVYKAIYFTAKKM